MELAAFGRVLIVLGAVIAVVGLVLVFADRIPLLGRLPGDILIRRDGLTISIPIATMIVVSIVVTLILNLVVRILR